jgi:RIO1 family protein
VIFAASRASGTDTTSRFVLKKFWDDRIRTGVYGVRKEFDALRLFHEALISRGNLRCPQPIAISPDGSAYLMTFLEGVRIDRHPPKESRERKRIVEAILHGLAIYYEKVGGLYADFQPRNIIVDRRIVGFIDPTLAAETHDRIGRQLAHQPATADVGYWLYSLAAQTTKGLIMDPVRTVRALRLTGELVKQAPDALDPAAPRAEFLEEVGTAADIRLHLLRERRGIKGLPLRLVGKQIVRGILQRAR